MPNQVPSKRKPADAEEFTSLEMSSLATQQQRPSAVSPFESSKSPNLPEQFVTPAHPLVPPTPIKREDFVVQMMEEGTIDEILRLIGHTAKLYSKGILPSKVIDELAKIIQKELGTQHVFTTKMVWMEQQIETLEETLGQLELENSELKKMEEGKQKALMAQSAESSDSKQGSEEKSKKARAAKPDKKKK